MRQTTHVFFGGFKFDPDNQCVWRGNLSLSLTPKAFAVFDYLLANRSRLVTKDELLEHVWSDSFVTDAVLKVCVREIRKALGDDPGTPRFIETVHRRGYRFIATIQDTPGQLTVTTPTSTSLLVGRSEADAQLAKVLSRALSGRAQIVFITGDPGAGKTALAEAFLRRVPENVLVTRGHALEQYGSGEAYMPILEAFTGLCRNDRNPAVVRALETHAPTWLAQMPSLAARVGQAALQRELLGATRERMLREMAEAMEAITSEVALVMLLEDLHWSDNSTIDLISYLARRRAPVRLLLIGTYRPVDAILGQHPLKSVKQELELHGMCQELPLDFLSEKDVEEYINRRLSPNDLDPGFSRLIHSRTDGNPLFMVTAIEFLENSGSVREQDGRWKLGIPLEQIEVEMPESLRDLIERQIGRISTELQMLLQAASVAGPKFSPSSISFGTELNMADAEEMCATLTRRGLFIRKCSKVELPDGTVTVQYEFNHSLYRNAFYDLVPMGKRLRMHRRIAEGQEALYGSHVSRIAAELALHFEEGREYVRAAKYFFLAAETVSLRYAYREAIAYLTGARELIGRLSGEERDDLESAALERLGLAWRSMGNMRQAAVDFSAMVVIAKRRHRLDDAVRALLYRSSVLSWFDRDECIQAAEEALQLSMEIEDELLRAHASGYCAYWRFLYTEWRDDDVQASRQAIAAAEQGTNKSTLSLHVGRYSYFLCMHSEYDEAVRTADRGIALAIEVGDFFDHSMTQFFKAWALLHSGQWNELIRLLDEASRLAERNEHHLWKTLFDLEWAWLHQQCGSVSEAERLCRKALDHVKETGHAYTNLMASTLLGHVLLDQHDTDSGMSCLLDVASSLNDKRVLMDWIWDMPLQLGLAKGWLRRREYEKALQAAQHALKIALQSRERTYMALAYAALAEIAHAKRDLRLASDHSSAAVELVATAAIPLAAERVYAVAGVIYQSQRKSKEVTECQKRAGEIREQIARSLQSAPHLQASFLQARLAMSVQNRTNA